MVVQGKASADQGRADRPRSCDSTLNPNETGEVMGAFRALIRALRILYAATSTPNRIVIEWVLNQKDTVVVGPVKRLMMIMRE